MYPVIIFRAIFLFLVFSVSAFAQSGYHDGHVVTITNDTLYGKVMDRKSDPFGKIYEKVRFKGKGAKKKYGARQLKSYKRGSDIYRKKYLDGEYVFLRLISEGEVSHYALEIYEQGEQLIFDVDYLQKGEKGQLVRATQGIFGLKRKNLIRFFSDYSPLVQKIKAKEINTVSEVAKFYNSRKEASHNFSY